MRWGFNDAWWPNLAENLDWLIRLGCDCVRFPVGLPLEVATIDPIYDQLLGLGLRPYIVLGGWNPAPPPETYALQVAPFADRYRKATICLWNEPNYHSPEQRDPLPVEDAIALNRAGERAAHEANPDARVLYSPVSPHGDWQAYFRRLYDALPEGDVAIHCYPSGRDDRLGWVQATYRLAAQYGRVHVTEIDMAAPWLGDPDAPKLAAKAYRLLDRLGAETTIYHSIENHRREAGALRQVRAALGDTPNE